MVFIKCKGLVINALYKFGKQYKSKEGVEFLTDIFFQLLTSLANLLLRLRIYIFLMEYIKGELPILIWLLLKLCFNLGESSVRTTIRSKLYWIYFSVLYSRILFICSTYESLPLGKPYMEKNIFNISKSVYIYIYSVMHMHIYVYLNFTYMYSWITFLYSSNSHNIVNQLYFNKNRRSIKNGHRDKKERDLAENSCCSAHIISAALPWHFTPFPVWAYCLVTKQQWSC